MTHTLAHDKIDTTIFDKN